MTVREFCHEHLIEFFVSGTEFLFQKAHR